MTGRMAGKVVLITGAARGQGRAHALRLAAEGAAIVAVDLPRRSSSMVGDADSGAELAETERAVSAVGGRIVVVPADVRRPADLAMVVAKGLETFGPIDVVIANAAIAGSRERRIWELTPDEWDELMAVNLRGVWQTVSAVIPSMIDARRGGSIVIIGSTCAFKGYPMTGHYTTAKHGLIGMMRVLANELGSHSIRINMISPTFVDTDLLHFESVYKAFVPELESPNRDDFEAKIRRLHLLPVPWVSSEDVSNAVLWFASDESRYITAQHLALDAGATEKA